MRDFLRESDAIFNWFTNLWPVLKSATYVLLAIVDSNLILSISKVYSKDKHNLFIEETKQHDESICL